MPKIRFRDSFANMLGEFVFLQKSPDYRPNAQSTQYIREAIRSELDAQKFKTSNMYDESDYSNPVHFRTNSSNSGYRNISRMPEEDYLSRRQSLPVMRAPVRLLQKLRGSKKGKYEVETYHNEIRNNESHRRSSVISESDETASISSASSRRTSCHDGLSMKL